MIDDRSSFGMDPQLRSDLSFDDLLCVEKWEKPLPTCLGGIARGNFPAFMPKTDQERVQNITLLFERWGAEWFQETTKMDGSSMSVYHIPCESFLYGQYAPEVSTLLEETPTSEPTNKESLSGVCSRNLDLVEVEGNMFWAVARKNQIIEKLAQLGLCVAIQGELCGSSIQSNFEGFQEGIHDFYVYDVWDIDLQRYYSQERVEELTNQLGLKHVPVHGYVKLSDVSNSTKDLLDRAEHLGLNGKKAEGKVYKHRDSDFSFKVISNSYLLKHGE